MYKQGIHLLLPTGRQVFSHLQESRVQSCVMVTWEDKCHPPLPSSFHFFLHIAEHDIVWHGISLWSVGVSCPDCFPSQLLVLPQPPRWWCGVRSRKDLDAV